LPLDRRFARFLLSSVVFVAFCVASPAAADIRVWAETPSPPESEGDEASAGEGEAAEPAPAAAPAATPERFFDLTAFAQPGFIVRMDDPNAGRTDDSFWLQRARLGFNARLFWWLRFRLEVEFSPVTLLQDAYFEISPHPAIQLRAGQFLVPFLRAYSFNELNLGFLDRPIYVPLNPDRAFIRYLNPRDVGFMAHGIVGDPSPSSTMPAFQYELGLFVGRGPNISANDDGIFLGAARFQLHVLGVPDGMERESDLARNHDAKVAIAASLYTNCDDRGNWNRGLAVDTELRYEGVYASAGFVWFRNSSGTRSGPGFHADHLFATYGACRGNYDDMGQPLDFVSRGAHLQVQYVLHHDLFPIEGMNLEVLARVDFVDANSPYDSSDPLFGGGTNTPGYIQPANFTDSDNPPTRYRLTFGLNFFPTGQQSIRLGINYQHNREAETVRTAEGLVEAIANDIFWIQITAGI
jgi:hypothetical protein